ncbi:hypothetical protein [Mesorhizobium sp. B2-3-4]|uniref:hypothetical protein n=1 Tax=Mesorhizobium sp. B2-3-4 TaxID=2589959 RepID=UPI00112E55D2|nr:hypothetical protein [Mesorhizobium sp. B2-3-4]TPM25693.1 hypothetical protein FJ967_32210 [Mesorhizobium sp. B2-3-4]
MSRIRTIKPEFFKHEELYDAEVETGLPLRLAFAGLWTQCDREGRFVWRPRQLKADILPYDELDFSRVLDALATRGFVVKYASDGRQFGHVPSWSRHQVINNRETASIIPPAVEIITEVDASSTRQPRVRHAGKAEGKGREGKGREEQLSEPSSDVRPHSRGPNAYPDDFEAFWLTYPRSPNMSKSKALIGWNKLTGDQRAACCDAVPAYRAFLTSKPDHPTMHAATFINERRFEGFAEQAKAATPRPLTDQDWDKRLQFGRRNQKWHNQQWGPPPGADGCKVPDHLIQPSDGQSWAEWEA